MFCCTAKPLSEKPKSVSPSQAIEKPVPCVKVMQMCKNEPTSEELVYSLRAPVCRCFRCFTQVFLRIFGS